MFPFCIFFLTSFPVQFFILRFTHIGPQFSFLKRLDLTALVPWWEHNLRIFPYSLAFQPTAGLG